MNARVPSLLDLDPRPLASRFLCVCADGARRAWLAHALGGLGGVENTVSEPAALIPAIAALAPALVFIDFGAAASSTSAAAVRDAFPGLPIVALGSLQQSSNALAALRAGVRDFVDVDGDPAEALRITKELIGQATLNTSAAATRAVDRHGTLTVLLGARAGVGVSTLAANLAVQVQKRHAGERTAALLDLGIPAADSSLLLDTRSEFNFVDAVRNLRRFDQTFVHTAFGRHASGLAVTALPADLTAMREVSYASTVSLLTRLRTFFDHQIVDLGGFSNLDFIAQVVQAADEVWFVCDPNVASVVSAVDLIAGLGKNGGGKLQLIVGKYDATLHFGAQQIAARLGLPLLATLPARAQALGRAVNQGRLLAEIAQRDPYVRALDPLVARIAGTAGDGSLQTAAWITRVLPSFLKRS
jgi:pilus assembly protein CpaE